MNIIQIVRGHPGLGLDEEYPCPRRTAWYSAIWCAFIATESGNLDKPVAAALNESTFVLSGVVAAPSQVFVFGKKVNDCRVVDYGQLFQ